MRDSLWFISCIRFNFLSSCHPFLDTVDHSHKKRMQKYVLKSSLHATEGMSNVALQHCIVHLVCEHEDHQLHNMSGSVFWSIHNWNCPPGSNCINNVVLWYLCMVAFFLVSMHSMFGRSTHICIDDVVIFHLEGVHSMYGRSTHILHMIGKFQSVASAKPCTDWPIFPTPERQSSWQSPLERKETAVSWQVVPTK